MARVIFIASLILFFAGISMAKPIDERIYLVPVGPVDTKTLENLKTRLPGTLTVQAALDISPSLEMPKDAYSDSRDQYLAEVALSELSQKVNLDAGVESALLITDADLYSPELNFVFGLADNKSKPIGIISMARLRNEFYGDKPDEQLFHDRVLKEAVHELGHAWGLEHCKDKHCVMFFSNNIQDTDHKSPRFCIKCNKSLRKRYTVTIIKKPAFLDRL